MGWMTAMATVPAGHATARFCHLFRAFPYGLPYINRCKPNSCRPKQQKYHNRGSTNNTLVLLCDSPKGRTFALDNINKCINRVWLPSH